MRKRNLMLVSALCVCTLLNGCNKANKTKVEDATPTVEAEVTQAVDDASENNNPTAETPTVNPTEEPTTQATPEPANNQEDNKAIQLFDSYIDGSAEDTSEVKSEERQLFSDSKTTSKNFAQFDGEWNRTECVNSLCGTLTIADADENGFKVSGDFFFYSHSGVLLETNGYYISDTKAVVEYSDPELDGNALILMELTDDKLQVVGIGGEDFCFGANVSLDGTYTLGEPDYTNKNALKETFTEEEQAKIKDLLTKADCDYDDLFLLPVEYGVGDLSEVTATFKDGTTKSGKWFSAFMPTMGGYDIELFLSEDGKLYFENSNKGFLTDDDSVKEMPVQPGQN